MAIPEKLTKPYDPKETEGRIYQNWLDSGFFNPDNLPNTEDHQPFCIIMPPPNANGHLHAGHALFVTLEDIMTRYKRQRGFKTLWLPGADHAGFETQVVYEKKLEKEGRSRFGMDRQVLYDEIYAFTQNSKKDMESEVRQLGASCDWSREKFTLDPGVIKTVYQTFKRLNDDNLLYRGKKIANWCTKHQTSLSDLECEAVERQDKLYYMKYGPLVVATVRPETMFGDTAVAVNPTDERYKQYIGQKIEVQTPIGTMSLPVIGDPGVEIEFGTGALKITPAHDSHDFEVGRQFGLEEITVIDQFGKMNEKAGKYAGLKVDEARAKVVEDLQAMGLLIKTEDYTHNVSTCYKCGKTLEPRIIPQWFVKTKEFANRAIESVKSGEIKIIPDYQEKIFFNWLENINDWNISRQIVWGIPIPAKICDQCDEAVIDIENTLTSCPKCGSTVHLDPDTFDTWFSSGQWPFATLGYPDSDDYKTYYPTEVMETGADIIFFWVARMIMLGTYVTGQVPFRTVYLHGLIKDKNGQKMSKSKGNVINPMEYCDKFGTDALRMALIVSNTPGTSMNLSEDKIKAYKHFSNKLWNISRFVVDNTEGLDEEDIALSEQDKKLIANFEQMAGEVTVDMDNFRFHLASEKLYSYVWHTFADEIIEKTKARLKDDSADKKSAQYMLRTILRDSIKLLHPFIPFITEEIWSIIKDKNESLLIVSAWPKTGE